jgi:signal transduction histidine kinase/ligand-binding sensor domain-containing protein
MYRWGPEDGLPDSKVECVLQTKDGYLWAGTQEGLARSDGVNFTAFDETLMPRSGRHAVFALAEDSSGHGLWITSTDGLYYYKDRQFRHFTSVDGLPHLKTWRILPMTTGEVWVETETDLARLANGRFTRFTREDGLPQTQLLWMAETPDHELLLGRQHWRKRFDRRSQRFVDFELTGLETNLPIRVLRFAQNGDWLIGTDQGFYRGLPGQWQHFDQRHGLEDPVIHAICDDPVNGLWIVTRNSGLYHFVHGRFDAVEVGLGHSEFAIDGVAGDREGNLWVATDGGLIQIRRRNVRVYSTQHGLASDDVRAVCEGPDGTMWVGTSEGVSSIRDGKVESFTRYDLFPSRPIRSIVADRAARVWLSMSYLAEFKGASASQLIFTNLIDLGRVEALRLDQQQRLWIGREKGVLVCRPKGDALGPVELGPLSPAGADVFMEDRAQHTWFANNTGLYRWDGQKLDRFNAPPGIATGRVHGLCQDADGTFWIGTERELIRWGEGGAPFRFDTRQGLIENEVRQILDDGLGFLWLGGRRGIYRVSQAELNDAASGKRPLVHCTPFGQWDGMLSVETSDDFNPACRKGDGLLWFATRMGLDVIDPRSILINTNPPVVLIERVKVDGRIVLGDGKPELVAPSNAVSGPNAGVIHPNTAATKLTLARGSGHLVEIQYTANSFVAPEKIQFQYQLEGEDQQWRNAGWSKREVAYPNLRPGRYRFRVRASNEQGYWNETAWPLVFSIAPAFTQTPFFRASLVLCTVLLALGVVGLAKWRLNYQRRAYLAEQTALVERERARIARDLHDDLGASLTGIALELEAAQRRSQAEGPRLRGLAVEARALADTLRELAWTTNPRCDNLGSLGAFLGEWTERFCAAANLACQLELPEPGNTHPVSARIRHDLLAIAKELLINTAKHAGADGVFFRLEQISNELVLTVRDDGQGFSVMGSKGGCGLQNLRERLVQAGGKLTLETMPGHGTCVTGRLPLTGPSSP